MSERLAITQFLPDIELPSVETGMLVPLRPSLGRTTILFGLHSATCEGCRRYLDQLASISPEFKAWDARLFVAVPGLRSQGAKFGPRFGTVLADTANRVSSRDDARVIVADQYGQIFESSYAGGGHDLPAPRQLEEWLKFLGTLCPE